MSESPSSPSTAQRGFQLLSVATAVALLAACGTLAPTPIETPDLQAANQADSAAMRQDVEPVTGPLTLDQAMARALKYNLDRRARLMEEAIALKELDVTQFDMLPKLLVQAGYTDRNRERATYSHPYTPVYGSKSSSSSFSSAADHRTADLGLTWNLLDVVVGQSSAKQAADRVLIAGEKRRKAMHVLMQDVRTVYWRAVSAQQLQANVQTTLKLAEEALADARKAEAERLRSPLDALRYQRQVLENLRLLEAIAQELSTAQVELASLINAPVGQTITLAEADVTPNSDTALTVPMAQLEALALENNADLREQHYNSRVAATEVRKTMTRLFPNLSFNYSLKYDSDEYLVHNNWNEAGLQLSFNLFNLFTGPTQIKLAKAGVALADQRRMATQMAVVTQLHLARLQLQNARAQFSRADAIYAVDQKIADNIRARQSVQAQSQLDRVANETTAILSLLRRYQALSQVHLAESRLIANLGLEPKIGSTGELSLAQLTQQVQGNPWAVLSSPKAQ
ncbi:TolC family protein [Macromonas nakdongensis]|uniref:TolC family protein n=1 Tax=Macromonas nakdongensis TaxID=1843082 RepID=UPI000C340599|nr:TolC family protein [Macromonas nakdongensis]